MRNEAHMNYEEWKATPEGQKCMDVAPRASRLAFAAGAASRDAEIETLRELKQAWHDKFWELDKQKNAEIAELVAELERLARLGNGDQYGNSEGNRIAQAALAKVRKP